MVSDTHMVEMKHFPLCLGRYGNVIHIFCIGVVAHFQGVSYLLMNIKNSSPIPAICIADVVLVALVSDVHLTKRE